jgi:dihydroflavonol-4-reductase
VKVLVLGATGHIGNAVIRELLHRGYQISAVSRRKEPATNLRELPVHYLCGDSDTPGQLDAWIKGHDVVVDAAAPYPIYLFAKTGIEEQRPLPYAERRTDTLLKVIRKHDVHLVYVSSFTTQLRQQQDFTGWQPRWLQPLHPYFAVKELIEAHLLAAARKGTPIIIVNPTLCLGPWDLKARELCFVPRILSGEIPVAAQQIVNVIDVRDVAAGLVSALQAKRYGEPILLSGHNIAANALQTWICEIGGGKAPRMSIPASFGLLPAYAMETLQVLTKQPVFIPALSLLLLCQHEWLAPSAAQQELGLVPRPLSETLQDTIQWYRELGYC